MGLVLNLFSVVAISAGSVFFIAGTLGLLRFPDPLSRLHALTKADDVGLGLVVLGLLPLAHGVLGALKLVVVWGLVQLSGATVGQLIAQSMRRDGPSR
jgi:multicomponent Na+:H+ antiporter subunit G